MSSKEKEVLRRIREVAHQSVPKGGRVLLYGSRARGDAREGSDWDLLILLDKPKLAAEDYDVTYPFRELGWDMNEEISPHIYTQKQWNEWTFLPYHKNVERDKIELL